MRGNAVASRFLLVAGIVLAGAALTLEMPTTPIRPIPLATTLASAPAFRKTDVPTSRPTRYSSGPGVVPLQVQAPRQSAPSDTHFQPATGEGLRIYPSVLSRLPKEFRLEAGDRVLSINGEAALSYDELWEAAAASVEGTSVELEIVLAGTDETVTVSVSR